MSDRERELRTLVDAFVDDLRERIHQETLRVVRRALTGDGASPDPSRRALPRPPRPRSARRPGVRRSTEFMAKHVEHVFDYIKANEGRQIGAIAQALNTTPKDVRLPLWKLLSAKRIVALGQRKGTRYFPYWSAGALPGGASSPGKRTELASGDTVGGGG